MRKTFVVGAIAFAAVTSVGCEDDVAVCPLIARFGFTLHVQDAATKQDLDRVAMVTIVRTHGAS